MHLTNQGKLMYYGGNYDTFVRTRQENEVNQMKRYEKEQADIKHIKEFIASCGTYANMRKQVRARSGARRAARAAEGPRASGR